MDPSKVTIPPMRDLTDANITPNAILINSNTPNLRLKYILSSLITHLHDFARETRLTAEEWMTGIQFLTATGRMCRDTRQEFILLSDILGLSTLVESINHPKPPGATEGTVLGPFHTHDAQKTSMGESIASPGKGEICLVRCTVKDASGNPIEGAKIDVWEADETGHYDTQYADRDGPDCRGILTSDKDGKFWFKAVKPVPYPIPQDGTVGNLLKSLHRHPYRPSHMHFMIIAPGFDTLVTALYVRGDPYETTDAVFGVKSSLVVDVKRIEDQELLREYGVPKDAWGIEYDFVMVTEKEARRLKVEKTMEALQKLGSTAKIVEGLPVAEVD
ncbi:Intradiol ring-cleavage dioxygenase [Kalaharituber pfeilii]|nr:Intradiol ring-cleavage dioxygenase [Kalaharituber pfeilii]